MIRDLARNRYIKATGPSLTAILSVLNLKFEEVMCTQLSDRGSDRVYLIRYETPRDVTLLDE